MAEKRKRKSFWSKPEGVTGIIFLLLGLAAAGFLVSSFVGGIVTLLSTLTGQLVTFGVLGLLLFMALDNKSRSLFGYMYKSVMRWITGLFVQIDPMGILKNYVEDLKGNLRKMNRQINKLRGQMHKLKEMMFNNQKEIAANLNMASKAKEGEQQAMMILKTRKAGRLKESNIKYEDLYQRMEVMYRVLTKMYQNSSILLEDIDDQVKMKEQERKALLAGHSAMKSAMSIIKGDPDKRAMFDMALEEVADDVSQKVGEMEQFMDMSEEFMASVDLQNGIFQEKGMKMLEEWEAKGDSLLLGGAKEELILQAKAPGDVLDLKKPITEMAKGRENQYDSFFD